MGQGSSKGAMVDLGGAYSNTKDQVRVLEELREKLPSLDMPEPTSTKRDRSRKARIPSRPLPRTGWSR